MDDNLFHVLKANIASQLEKTGSSIDELEASLGSLNEAEGAVKVANILGNLAEGTIGGLGKLVMSAPEIAMASALLLGSTAGGAAYAADRHIQDQDKGLKNKEQEIDRMKSITGRLKSDYGIK